MQIYNTLTRKKEPFVPHTPGKVGMYTCGITAYDYSHIGHARSAVAFDVLVRYLRFTGLDVTFVRNFTDVDDKIINRANEQGRTSEEVAAQFMAAYHEDMDRIGVTRPDVEPLATEHIPDMIRLCEILIERGRAYATSSGDVYFRVRAFPGYGKLSGRDPDDLRSGARVLPGEEKEDPLDFALWKSAKPGEPRWASPWGEGRPGWHIECSAMSEKHLPLPLDIHGGGLDLIFPHHENEIAQTEAALDKALANYWVHNGFVQVNSEKMSKSLNNFKTIRDILEAYLPETLRFFLLSKHYRTPVDFSFDSMDETERGQKRIYETLAEVHKALAREQWKSGADASAKLAELEDLHKAFLAGMDDDCNTAAAIGHIFGMIHLAGGVLEDKKLRVSEGGREFFERLTTHVADWTTVLGLFGLVPADFLSDLRAIRVQRKGLDMAQAEALLAQRVDARAAKDYARADALRAELAALGVEARDTPEGQTWDLLS